MDFWGEEEEPLNVDNDAANMYGVNCREGELIIQVFNRYFFFSFF